MAIAALAAYCCALAPSYTVATIATCTVIRVVSLAMSPVDDMFLSGSLDGTVRLWDLRVNPCQVQHTQRAFLYVWSTVDQSIG